MACARFVFYAPRGSIAHVQLWELRWAWFSGHKEYEGACSAWESSGEVHVPWSLCLADYAIRAFDVSWAGHLELGWKQDLPLCCTGRVLFSVPVVQ